MQLKMKLEKESAELAQLLTMAGLFASTSMAEHVIGDGLVRLDGRVERDPRSPVKKGQTIEINGTFVQTE